MRLILRNTLGRLSSLIPVLNKQGNHTLPAQNSISQEEFMQNQSIQGSLQPYRSNRRTSTKYNSSFITRTIV